MIKGDKYQLISFNGTTEPDHECSPNENYWKLIGQVGTLVNFAEELNFRDTHRVLIQFEQGIEAQGLACHNVEVNTLWILKSDLEESTLTKYNQ